MIYINEKPDTSYLPRIAKLNRRRENIYGKEFNKPKSGAEKEKYQLQ
jgi:hypothetical protein